MSIDKMNDFSFKWSDVAGNYMKTSATDTKSKMDIRGIELRNYINAVIDIINLEGASHIGAKDIKNTSKTVQELFTFLLNANEDTFNNLKVLNTFKNIVDENLTVLNINSDNANKKIDILIEFRKYAEKIIKDIEVQGTANSETLLDLKNTFDKLIIDAGNNNSEIVVARYDNISNLRYKTIGERLDNNSLDIINKPSFAKDSTTNVDIPAVDEILKSINENYSDVMKNLDLLEVKKVEKINGKGLSTNDFTNEYKYILDNYLNNLLNKIYPIGSIYLSMNNVNPKDLFGGDWQSISQGRVLVGVDTTQTEFNTSSLTGGSKTHVLTQNEMPEHSHTSTVNNKPTVAGTQSQQVITSSTSNAWTTAGDVLHEVIGNSGNNAAHNNLQPYLTCYMWQRVS